MDSLLSQIEAIAAPIVRHYHADITTHDAEILAEWRTGDSALWACYECGSHIAPLRHSDESAMSPNMRRATAGRDAGLWRAQESTFGGQIAQWYLLQSFGGGAGTVTPIARDKVRDLYRDLLDSVA